MKKFICVLVFLALVSVANAGVIDLVVSGVSGQNAPDPRNTNKEVWIAPTDVVALDIIYTPSAGLTLFGLSVDIASSERALGSFDVSGPTWPTGVWDMNPPMTGVQINADGSAGVWASAAANGSAGGIAADHILFHCDGPGTVILSLLEDGNLPPGATVEADSGFNLSLIEGYGTSVIIHQIVPEPMTLTLLGLGGLFLARRKR
jgi:hypothetical protein